MQHGHALDSALSIQVVVTLRYGSIVDSNTDMIAINSRQHWTQHSAETGLVTSLC